MFKQVVKDGEEDGTRLSFRCEHANILHYAPSATQRHSPSPRIYFRKLITAGTRAMIFDTVAA